jgi:type I restriction enzyme R subunit
MPTPEERARKTIDAVLVRCGWVVQSHKRIDPSAGRGLAVRDVRLVEGRCDYLLLLDRNPVGFVKARKKTDVKLPAAAKRSDRQGEKLPHYLAQLFPVGIAKLPFHYETTGTEIYFRDEREARPRLRPVFAFHRPATLARWLEEPPADNQ